MTPELIRVAGGDNEPTIFSRQGSTTTASAWVYALQAAKVGVTVFGIWLGHVYQLHLVTAAMVMTMFENLSPKNPVYRLLEPQSSYVIPFDDLLLLGWDALPGIPPTSLATAPQLLELIDLYAEGREFFDDDPTTTLERLGLTEADFTRRRAVGPVPDRRRPVGDLGGDRPLRGHLRRARLRDRRGRGARPRGPAVDRGVRSRGRRQRARPAGHGLQGRAEAGPSQHRLPHRRARRLAPVQQRQPGAHVRRELPARPAGRDDPPAGRRVRQRDPAPVHAQHRQHRLDGLLLLHVLGVAALCAVRAARRRGDRPLLRRRRRATAR